jgi:hypothetical protein
VTIGGCDDLATKLVFNSVASRGDPIIGALTIRGDSASTLGDSATILGDSVNIRGDAVTEWWDSSTK